jgi:hypothetical protein
VERDTAQRNDNVANVQQANSDFSPPPKGTQRASAKPRRITRTVEIELGKMGATTMDGFKQVFGCRPQYIREIYEHGKCVAVECTGDVA